MVAYRAVIRGLLCAALLGCAAAGGCLGLNEDFVAEDTDPANATTTSSSTSGTSVDPPTTSTAEPTGSSSSDDSSATATASESTAAADVCTQDPYEMNDDQGAATDLPAIMISDPSTFIDAARLDGDEDWYRIPVVDDQITLGVTAEVDADLQVCVFALCNAGLAETTVWACHFDALPDTSPLGYEGCCRAGVTGFDYSCGAAGRDADIFVHVSATATTPAGCVPYELRYEL